MAFICVSAQIDDHPFAIVTDLSVALFAGNGLDRELSRASPHGLAISNSPHLRKLESFGPSGWRGCIITLRVPWGTWFWDSCLGLCQSSFSCLEFRSRCAT
jgi:hypothetical protein